MNFHKVVFPTSNKSNPPVGQLLGINKFGEAIGFYVDAKGNSHGYLNNALTRKFITIPLPGAVSVTGTGINSKHAVVRFFGVNDNGEVVGAYTIGTKSFGFTSTVRQHFRTFSEPHAIGTTVVNGVNNAGHLVGFFNSSNGRMHGMLAKP